MQKESLAVFVSWSRFLLATLYVVRAGVTIIFGWQLVHCSILVTEEFSSCIVDES